MERGKGTHQLVLSAADVGDVHVVSRGREILVLLAGENVGSDKMDLGVTVLAGLGGGHVDNLARAVLDHDVTVLPQGRALHGEGGRGTGLSTGIVLKLQVIESVRLKDWIVEFSVGLAKPSGWENGKCEDAILRYPDGHRGAHARAVGGAGCVSSPKRARSKRRKQLTSSAILKKLERILGLSEEEPEAAMPKKMSNGPKEERVERCKVNDREGMREEICGFELLPKRKKGGQRFPAESLLGPSSTPGGRLPLPPALDR